MKKLKKEPYWAPSVEMTGGLTTEVLCSSALNGGNTEDLFFEDWDKLLGGGSGGAL